MSNDKFNDLELDLELNANDNDDLELYDPVLDLEMDDSESDDLLENLDEYDDLGFGGDNLNLDDDLNLDDGLTLGDVDLSDLELDDDLLDIDHGVNDIEKELNIDDTDDLDNDALDLGLDLSDLIIEDNGDLLSLPGELLGTDDLVLKGDLDSAINAEDDFLDENLSRDLIEKRLKQRNKPDAKIDAFLEMQKYAQEFEAGYITYFAGAIPVSHKLRLEDIIKSVNPTFSSHALGELVTDILTYFEQRLSAGLKEGDSSKIITPEDILDIKKSEILGIPVMDDVEISELTTSTFDINMLISLLTRAETRIRESVEIVIKNTDKKKSLESKLLETYFSDIGNVIGNLNYIIGEMEYDEDLLENDVTFVDSINLSENTFVCGACGETSKCEVPFYTNVTFPEDRGTTVKLYSVFGMNSCDSCTCNNILEKGEMSEIHKAHRENKGNILRNLESFHLNRDASGNRTDDFSYTKYLAPIRVLKNRVPGLFTESESRDVVTEQTTDEVKTNLAVQRYLDLLKFFKNKTEEPTVLETIKSKKEVDNLQSSLVKVKPVIVDEDNLNYTNDVTENKVLDNAYKHELLAKLICSILNRDYNENKENAINSFLHHICTTPNVKYLLHSNHAILRGAKMSGSLIKDLSKLEGDKLVAYSADILTSLLPETRIDLTKLNKSHLLSILREEYGKVDARIEEYNEKRISIIQSLNDNINNYAYLPISALKIDKDIKLDLLQDDDFRYIVDIITNRMIINSMSEEFFYTWLPSVSPSATREIDADKATRDSIYVKLENLLSSDKLKYKIPKGEMVEGIYPDSRVMTCLELLLKLQNDLSTDEFRAIVTCNEIINSPVLTTFKELGCLENVESFVISTVNKYGKTDLGRLQYYLEPLGFSKEEIAKAYSHKYININFNRIIAKEPGDTVESYLNKYIDVEGKYIKRSGDIDELKAKLINLGFEKEEVDTYVTDNWNKCKELDLNLDVKPKVGDNLPNYLLHYKEVQSRVEKNSDNWSKYEYVPYENKLEEMIYNKDMRLDSLFVVALSAVEGSSVKNPGASYGMITMFNSLIQHYDSSKIIINLGFSPELVNGLVNNIPKQNHLNLDYSSFRQDIRVLSYVYDDLKINDILKGTDNVESRISKLLNDYKDSLPDYLEYLPDSERDFVDNFRLSRNFSPANIVLLED